MRAIRQQAALERKRVWKEIEHMADIRHILFKDFVVLQRGFDLPKKDMIDGPFPVVGSTSIIGYHNENKVDPPGVATGRSGSLGFVQYIRDKYWPHNTSLWVKDFKGNFPRYVYYYLQILNLQRFNSGVGVPTLNRNDLDTLEIAIHSVPTQRKIASILSAYDDLIENNNRRIKMLEEMAQAIYREWFVSFRFPGHEKVKMVKSELGMIPEGWEVKKIEEVIELAYGKALKKDDRINGDIPVYGSGGICGTHNKSLIEGPGIIVGRKGNVGSVFWSEKSFYPIDTVYYVKSSTQLHYIYFNLLEQQFNNTDAAVPGLSRNQAYKNKFLLPAGNILELFTSIIKPIFNQSELLINKNNNLCKTRDLLLPKLISGKIDVESIKIETE